MFNPFSAATSASLSGRSLSGAEGPVSQASPGVIQIFPLRGIDRLSIILFYLHLYSEYQINWLQNFQFPISNF